MDHLVFTNVRLCKAGPNPQRFAAREIRKVGEIADVCIAVADSLDHRERASLSLHLDHYALVTIPHHPGGALDSHEQAISAYSLESHPYRQSLVGICIVSSERRILIESRGAGAPEQIPPSGILVRRCNDRRSHGRAFGESCSLPYRVARVTIGPH